jgi:hypothetical protein
MFWNLVEHWGSAWKFPQGSIGLEFDLCNAVRPIRTVEPDRSTVLQLKMFHAVMSSDTCRVIQETPIEADLVYPYRTSEGRCWICMEHWWNGDWLGNLPHGHFFHHKYHENSWYSGIQLFCFWETACSFLSFGMVCKVAPESQLRMIVVCVVSAAVKIRTYDAYLTGDRAASGTSQPLCELSQLLPPTPIAQLVKRHVCVCVCAHLKF